MSPSVKRFSQVQEDLPAFIVGLPQDSFEADLAKSKFAHTVGFLKKLVPTLEEAKCKIKVIHSQGKKIQYQVDVNILTPHKKHQYTNTGWDLAKIFDQMDESLRKSFVQEKRMASKGELHKHE
jgi:hypothetical protein